MSKEVFYLKDSVNPEFFTSEPDEVICWVFRCTCKCGKQIAYSVDLHELIEKHYFLN